MDRHNPLDVAAAMRTVAHELSSRTDLASTLDTLVHGAVTALPDIDHAGISVVQRRGRIETVSTTDPFVNALDDLQYTHKEGPCVDAVFEEPVVRVQHARHETRWPRFMPPAVDLGLRSQLGIRLYTEERTIGVLNLYSTSSDSITDEVEQMAELFAAYATSALGRAQGQDVLDSAMASRQLIGQATGIVMERFSMDESRAFEYLLRVSSLSNTKLRDISREMVESSNKSYAAPDTHADLPGPGAGAKTPIPTPGGGTHR